MKTLRNIATPDGKPGIEAGTKEPLNTISIIRLVLNNCRLRTGRIKGRRIRSTKSLALFSSTPLGAA